MKFLNIKQKAIYYRNKGYSYNMISQRLEVSKSTLSDWLKELPYHPNAKVIKRIKEGPAKSGQIRHNQKVANILKMKRFARKELGELTKRDLWLLGIGLYLGEGSKSSNGTIRVINSNPDIVVLAIKWFKDICGLTIKNFNLALHLYPDNNIKKSIDFWSKITGIPKDQFGKTQIDIRIKKSIIRKNKLPNGTAHLTIKSNGNPKFGVTLQRRILGWLEAVTNQ
jgi:hypothetical protein